MMYDFKNLGRATIGQGLMLGWGDEAEAWLRSKAAGEDYNQALAQIRQSYSQFGQSNPVSQVAGEFAGAVIPGAAAMMFPGAQPAGAAAMTGPLARAAAILKTPMARMVGTGAAAGGVSAAGYAPEGQKSGSVLGGAAIGAGAGAAVPLIGMGLGSVGRTLAERVRPTTATIEDRAAGKMLGALDQSGLKPNQLPQIMAGDQAMGVPSVLANADPALVDLAQAIAQRSGASARKVESTLDSQKLGARERTVQQVRKGLQPGDYYDDLAKLQKETRARAESAYKQAYQFGEVTDPEVLQFLQLPQFQAGMKEAEKLLAAEGKTMDMSKPTVEVLDNIKRGVDSLIERETDAVTGKMTNLGRVYSNSKREFLNKLDTVVPDYGKARAVYRGDAEVADAMKTGFNDFNKLDHEQVIKLVGSMSAGEKEAFKTGVARHLYSKVMDPSSNINAAQRVIGAPEMKAKLRPLFDNAGQYRLFEAALTRESQLYHQANRILAGSPTAKRMQMREMLEGNQTGGMLADAVTGGFTNSLTNMAANLLRGARLPEKTADKLADMLMSSDPAEVAAVVQLLERKAASLQPAQMKFGVKSGGFTSGTLGTMWKNPAPGVQQPEDEVE